MSTQKTITITDHNGAKVRTVASKRYYVVNSMSSNYLGFDSETGKSVFSDTVIHTATVRRRTDSAVAALAELRQSPYNRVYQVTTVSHDDRTLVARPVADERVMDLAADEKRRKAFVSRSGSAQRGFY